jgi:hypothetical protein
MCTKQRSQTLSYGLVLAIPMAVDVVLDTRNVFLGVEE